MTWREKAWERICAMAGLDAWGQVLPPTPGAQGIDRTALSFWKNSAVTKSDQVNSVKFQKDTGE